MSNVLPPRVNYEQRVVDVLKATAVNQCTITSADLAWAINYQRTTRTINDLLLHLKPLFADHDWPPLTSLVVLRSTHRPSPVLSHANWRQAQQQCWSWARLNSDQRARVRGRAGWSDTIIGEAG